MNTATTTQRIRTTCALSLALLVSGTTSAAHMHEHSDSELYRYENFVQGTPSCARTLGPRVIINQASRQTAQPCNTVSASATIAVPPVRLARPLSDTQYNRSGDSNRYSF